MVKKTFPRNTDTLQQLLHHQRIYTELDQKKVPYTDKLISTHSQKGFIMTGPVGDPQPPETGQAVYDAIVCVLEALVVIVFLILWLISDIWIRRCMRSHQFTTATFGEKTSSEAFKQVIGSSLTSRMLLRCQRRRRTTYSLRATRLISNTMTMG